MQLQTNNHITIQTALTIVTTSQLAQILSSRRNRNTEVQTNQILLTNKQILQTRTKQLRAIIVARNRIISNDYH